jgi:hypothetical protein
MFTNVIVKTIIAMDPDEVSWNVLNICILPFAPFPELYIIDPALEIECAHITWIRNKGFFRIDVDDYTVEDEGKTTKEIAKEMLTEDGWKVAVSDDELDEAIDTLVKKAHEEIRQTILRAQLGNPMAAKAAGLRIDKIK